MKIFISVTLFFQIVQLDSDPDSGDWKSLNAFEINYDAKPYLNSVRYTQFFYLLFWMSLIQSYLARIRGIVTAMTDRQSVIESLSITKHWFDGPWNSEQCPSIDRHSSPLSNGFEKYFSCKTSCCELNAKFLIVWAVCNGDAKNIKSTNHLNLVKMMKM